MSALLAAITEALEGKKTGSGYMCRCPAHDDDRASLSVSAGEKKEIVVCCHAGCAQDAVIDALRARGLWRGNGADTKKRKIAATYDYGDQHGKLVFQVVRYLPKDFRQRRPDGAGGWVWNTRGVTPVPYRLPAVLAAITAGEPVCVVEGEKDVESLARIGLVATCNSGGAGKWRKAHAQWLKGANVTIVPDNDEPGRSHAKQVARSLAGIADARIVELPGLSPKGDVSDWLAAGGTRELLEQLAAGAPKTDDGTDADNRDGKDGKDDRPTVAKVLIDLALKSCDLFHDERADGYAVTMYNGIRRTLKLRGREFRRWLAGSFYAATDRAANNDAISTALSVLEAKATFDGRQLELSNRFAMRDGIIYIDMADTQWRVIKVTADGWEVMDKPPVLFRRYSHQQALPDPVRGGKLSDLHRHFAIKYDDDKLLVEAWLVASAFPNVPCPAIDFHGSQGASKTTTARCLRSLADPSVAESVDLGKSPVELAQVLDHHGVPYFDNVTSIPSWAADMLCRAVTGGAFSKRELYSDDSDILLTFKRPMIITGINIPTHAPDLLDRLLLIELERIPADKRMDEATFWSRFDADRPKLFGSLLDAIAGALRYLPNIKLDRMPRMADFARVACAYAEFAGTCASLHR